DKVSDKEEIQRLKTRVESTEITATLAAMDKDRIERELYSIRVWLFGLQSKMIRRGAVEARPSRPQGPLDSSYAIDKLILDRVTEVVAIALAQHEGNRANVARVGAGAVGPVRVGNAGRNARGNAGGNARGNVTLKWFEKMDSVFQISKYVDEDMVKYVVCNLEGRALTWWNDHVHSLGINDANRIPWNELKDMMTADYCPRTEIKKMKQEFWNLTMTEMILIDTLIISTIQGNVTSSKPATIHEAIRMACGLVDQVVQAKAARIIDSNKRKWEDQQRGNTNNRNNTHHHQQNQRQEAVKAYVVAPAEGKKVGHLSKDFRSKTPTTGSNTQQVVTCYGCEEKGHYKNKCPKKKDQQDVGARGRAYVQRIENEAKRPEVAGLSGGKQAHMAIRDSENVGVRGNTLVYEQVLCDNQNYGLDRYPYYSLSPPQQFYYREDRGGPHYSSDCQTRNPLSPPQDLEYERLSKILIDRLREDVLSTQIPNPPFDIDTKESDDDTEVIFDKELFLRESTAHVTPPPLAYTPPSPFLATMKPLDTLLMRDEVISTTTARENDEFIKSSVNDLVLILREFEDSISNVDHIFDSYVVAIHDPQFEIVTPLPIFQANICLREVERFDPFLSLTRSSETKWVMVQFLHRYVKILSPCPVACSPKVVMYRYFHPHLILSDGCVLEPRSK
ncbi:putative reverse transcriptase domain-containing protein, partial [Tanacetum coccineum]